MCHQCVLVSGLVSSVCVGQCILVSGRVGECVCVSVGVCLLCVGAEEHKQPSDVTHFSLMLVNTIRMQLTRVVM